MKQAQQHIASRLLSNRKRLERDHALSAASFQALEPRVFLSATASVTQGNLNIRGDGSANAIVIDQAGLAAGQVRISGAGGTSINGQANPVIVSGVTRGVDVRMGNAADSVTLQDMNVAGNLSVSCNGGDDTVVIARTTVGKNLTIASGTDAEDVTLQSATVQGNTRISSRGKVGAHMTIDDSTFQGTTELSTGDGADVVQIDTHGDPLGAPTVFSGSLLIALNGGNDTLQLGATGQSGHHVTFGRKVRLDGDAGFDTLSSLQASPTTRFDIRSFELRTLTPDTTAPTVVSSDPADGQQGTALNKKISVAFSEAMDQQTINGNTVSVTAPGGVAVDGTIGYVGTTMTFTPAAPLAANTVFTVTITTGATDLAGNALASDFVANFRTGSALDATAPTVTATDPVNLQTNVPINKKVAATFSESIDPLTISGSTFTLRGPGNAHVAGTVNYDGATKTATFAPTSTLAPNTTYTARIVGGANGAKDLAGNPLASDDVWTFTTGAKAAQATINLGRASTFAVMATASITSSGLTQINGNVGLNPGSSQGIPPAQVNGMIHVNDQAVIDAQTDLLAAYNDAVSRTLTSVSLPGNMGGLTFTPGLYTNSTSVLISGAGPKNNVTLDAQGDPNAIFIFKMGSTLTTGPGAQVILAGGAKASNIFWQVGTSATLNTTTIFKGTIMASVTITVNSGSVVDGRLLGGSNSDGSVTINASTVTLPS